MNPARPAVGSVTGSVVAPPRGMPASGGGGAGERVQNGGFDSATGWSGAGWSIASGVATNNIPGSLTNVLTAPLGSGDAFPFSIDIIANPASSGVEIRLVNSTGTPSPQVIYANTALVGTLTFNEESTGNYDRLVIINVDDPGLIIDNVSLIA